MKKANDMKVFIYIVFTFLVFSIIQGCRKAPESRHGRNSSSSSSKNTENVETKRNDISARGQRPTISNKRSSNKLDGSEIFDRYGSAVFMIFTTDGSNTYQGSGFFINKDGLAVSNYHVFKGTSIGLEQIKLVDSDEVYNISEVLAKSEEEDFILFRVDCENTNYIPIAADKPKIGEKVYAIGSPRGLENTFSSGEVSQWRADNLMQISALIDHGSSGGALINEYGEVVGITSGSFADGSQANLNYAWSIDVIKFYIN